MSAAAAAAHLAAAHLAAIAGEPRPAGGPAEARARAYCAGVLRSAGFEVREEPFTYSATVGRWAMPTSGALVAGAVLAGGALARADQPAAAAGLLVATMALVQLGARWGTRHGVLELPTERCTATNLVATRGGESPTVWLVAHLDSKSQPVPMLARVAGVIGTAVAWVAAVALTTLQWGGVAVGAVWPIVAGLAVVAAIPVMGSVIGARSPGALDNASGVVTLLLAATAAGEEALPTPIGVLMPSAEELGLAGARAWAVDSVAQRILAGARRPVAINVDGVDDGGKLRVLVRGSGSDRLPAAAAAAGVDVRAVPAGVLVDAIALGDAGFDAVTVSRGTTATLARIHRPSDSLAQLTGAGIPSAAALVRHLATVAAVDASDARLAPAVSQAPSS